MVKCKALTGSAVKGLMHCSIDVLVGIILTVHSDIRPMQCVIRMRLSRIGECFDSTKASQE